MRLVFLGTPDFAVPTLRALIEEGFDVAAVVTQPDRARGRHRSAPIPSPVKVAALEENLNVVQPSDPNSEDFRAELCALGPEIGVVVGYGHILKPHLLDLPSRGMINVHASLLPKLRGAAPIEQAIINGDDETGVSVIQLIPALDAGPVIHQLATPIAPDETGSELTERLAELGALALIEALALVGTGTDQRTEQDDAQATYAPKLTRKAARIQWDRPAYEVARRVRALDSRIGAWTTLNNRALKFFGPRLIPETCENAVPGEIVTTSPFSVATGLGALEFDEVQPAGRRRMSTREWLRGKPAEAGDRFE
ncbi:MAG: methionyl-tRNA formyltransferase [Gemmatimonadales bacterium]